MADPTTEELPELAAPAKVAGSLSIVKWAGIMLALTLVSAAMGGGLGIKLVEQVEEALRARDSAQEEPVISPTYALPTHLKPLAPIVTNLASPSDIWIRIECAMVFEDEEIASDDVLAGEIGQDILNYLKTVSLSQIEGPSGMQHLREDIAERARIRSGDRVRDVVFQTMVVQ